ncbi:MAG TPA: alcohol dehydrogenase catalytic domain-containing protein, partial [Pyrinomonadaceae bacterium]|nr:alcohol dehydrogenase catalytic domain-containing protein [Pyrinomonadaceae bacterium]
MNVATASLPTVRGSAAIIVAPEQIEVREVEFREPAAGEVRVRIEGCGVCASSVPLWQGKPWFQYPVEPGAPGHEAWGHVDAIGDGVTEVAKG